MAGEKIDIGYVAQLARLELPPEQAAQLQGELESIVHYIDELAELDVTGVEPTAHAAPLLCSYNLPRSNLRRSLASKYFLRRRICFGVTSTNSSSAI